MLSRKTVYKYIAWNPILEIARRTILRNRIVVLMYHEVLNDNESIDAWTVVEESDFIRQMEYLRSHFRIVSLDEVYEKLYHQSVRTDKNLAVVTFDDGYTGNRKVVLPIIESMGIPITLFVTTGAILNQRLNWYDQIIMAFQTDTKITIDLKSFGLRVYETFPHLSGEKRWIEIEMLLNALKALTPDKREEAVEYILERFGNIQPVSLVPLTMGEVEEMAKSPLVTIGAHSHCHNRLVQLSKEEIKESVIKSKILLEDWTRRPVHHFAYPNGDFNTDVVQSLKEAGFYTGLTTSARLWGNHDLPFTIPRIGIGRYETFESFISKVSGVII